MQEHVSQQFPKTAGQSGGDYRRQNYADQELPQRPSGQPVEDANKIERTNDVGKENREKNAGQPESESEGDSQPHRQRRQQEAALDFGFEFAHAPQ